MSETNTNGNLSKKAGFMSEFGEEQLSYISERLSNLLFDTKLLQALNNTGIFKSSKLWGELNEALSGKVSSEDGKGLSSNDFTDEEKAKIEQLIADIKTKQKLLTFDNLPMSDSSNPVTSDGVYKADEVLRTLIDTKCTELINKLNDAVKNKVDSAEGYGLANAGITNEVSYPGGKKEYAFINILTPNGVEGLDLYTKRQIDNIVNEIREIIDNLNDGGNVTVDSELSSTSENPVQNKVIGEVVEAIYQEMAQKISGNELDIYLSGSSELNKKVDKINGMGLARIGSYGTSYYIAYQACDDGTAMNIEVYDTDQTDTAISNTVKELKLKSIPHTIASGNPVFIGDRLSGEKLISIKVYGANGGVGDLQDDGSYKTSLSVSAKNMFNPEFLKVTAGGIYGYYKMIDTNEDLVMSLRVKDESVTLPDGTAVMFTYRGYDAKYQDDGQAEYLVPIWINNRHMGEYVLNEKNGICLKYLSFYPNSKSTIEAIKAKFDIQIERGNVATELEPYIPPVEVSVSTPLPINKGETVNITEFDIPESDAYTISSATVVSPSKIEVEYYQDINKVISELKNAILAQGGNV